jgi:hypothetical protein
MIDKGRLLPRWRRPASVSSPYVYLSLALACLLLWPQVSFGGPAAPIVTAVSPTSGAAGTQVTITGGGFSNGFGVSRVIAVNFGTVSSTFTFISDGEITATIPNGFSGTVNVTVVTSGGTTSTSASDLFTLSARVFSTPVLSPWSMIALTLLLACFGGFALRRKFA